MLLGSYKSRERRLEHLLTEAQVEAAQARRDRFIIACQEHHIPLSVAVIHRSYIEAMEEIARGDAEEPIATEPSRYERRDYGKVWGGMDWPS